MQRLDWLVGVGLFVVAAMPASAQVRCTMPNGVVIEQRLTNTCPAGATKAETSDGSPAKIRGPILAPPAPVRTGPGGQGKQLVSKAEFGAAWPLTVDAVELRCVLPNPAYPNVTAAVFEYKNQVYALNGTAASWATKMGWADHRSIWRDSVIGGGTKVSISPLISRALLLCR